MEEKLSIKYLDVRGKDDQFGDVVTKGNNYTTDDCLLVRTTDVFPFDGVIRIPKEDGGYEFGSSTILEGAIRKAVRSKYHNIGIDEEQTELYEEEMKSYNVVFETCRSTIHFCMNGLVTSHSLGNFDAQPYIIIEPFKYHTDSSLKCLRVEDTYYDKEMLLSNEAVIMISSDKFDNVKTNLKALETLKNFRVVVYNGKKDLAVKEVIKSLGYDLFMVNNHGYYNGITDGEAAFSMREFIYNYATQNGISLDRHFNSEINRQDTEERMKKGEEIDKHHLFYIINNSSLPEGFILKIQTCLQYNLTQELDNLTDELVKIIGLDKIRELTSEFNKQYIAKLSSTKSKTM